MKHINPGSLTLAVSMLLGILPCSTPAQVVILSGFDHTYDTTAGLPTGSGWGVLSYGAGIGGSEAVVMTFDLPSTDTVAAYSYQNPNAIGNTSANINDYTLSFDVEVNSANSSMSLAVNTFTGSGLRYRTGEVGFPGGLQITSANVFEHFELNLGSFVPTHLNFDPRGSIWMISFTGNYTGFAVPSVGNQILFSNFEVTMAPEPSLLALFGLSTAGVLILFRNRQ